MKQTHRTYYLVCAIWLLGILSVHAQTHKLTVQALGGMMAVPGKEQFNTLGQNERVFAGFKTGLLFEVGGYYHFRRHFLLGIAGGHWGTTKPNYSLSSTDYKIRFGYMFNPNPKFFYPYFFGGVGLAELKLARSHYTQVLFPNGQSTDGKDVAIHKITNTYSSLTLQVPVPVVELGLGFTLVLNRRWNLGVTANMGYYLAKGNSEIKNEYTQNKGALLSFSGSMGIGYTILYRDKPKDINNFYAKSRYNKGFKKRQKQGEIAAKHNAKLKELAHTHFPHTAPGASAKHKEVTLSEPRDVHTIDKATLNPNKNISVLGKVKGSGTEEVVVLSDTKSGQERKVNSKHGYFAYTNLKPDNYNLKVQNAGPHVKSEIKVAEEDASQKILVDDFKKYEYKKVAGDPFDHMVQGQVKDIQSGKVANKDVPVLLVNDKNEVVARTQANAKGNFAFQKMRPDNYTALVESPDNALRPEIKVGDDDPALNITAAQLKSYRFHALNQELVDGAIVVGNVKSTVSTLPIQDQTVFIVDGKGNVEQTKTNAKGQFAFKNLTVDNHQVYLENPDPNLKVTVHPVDESPEMMVGKERLLKYNFNKLKGDSIGNNVLLGSVNLKGLAKEAENVEILLLDDAGNVVNSTVVNKNGHFSFHHLNADNYKAVVNSKELRVQAQLHAPVNDPLLAIKGDDLASYNATTHRYERLGSDAALIAKGEIVERGSKLPVEDHSVFLVDEAGTIQEVVHTNKEGGFLFSEMKQGNYQVLYETKGEKEYQHTLQLYKGGRGTSNKGPSYMGTKKEHFSLHYANGTDHMEQADTSKFNRLIRQFKANPKAHLSLKAYASNNESDKTNLSQLNLKRMESIKKRLVSEGITPDRLEIQDMGLPLQKLNQPATNDEGMSKIEAEVME